MNGQRVPAGQVGDRYIEALGRTYERRTWDLFCRENGQRKRLAVFADMALGNLDAHEYLMDIL